MLLSAHSMTSTFQISLRTYVREYEYRWFHIDHSASATWNRDQLILI